MDIQQSLKTKKTIMQLVETSGAYPAIGTSYSGDARRRIVKLHSVDCEDSGVKLVYEQVLVCGSLEMKWTEPHKDHSPDWQCAPLGMYHWRAESGEKSCLSEKEIPYLVLANTVFTEQPALLRATSHIGPFNTMDVNKVDDFVFPKETILKVVGLFASRSIAVSRIELVQAEYYDQWPIGETIAEMSPSSEHSENPQNWLEFAYRRRLEAERFLTDHPASDEQFYRIDGISKGKGKQILFRGWPE